MFQADYASCFGLCLSSYPLFLFLPAPDGYSPLPPTSFAVLRLDPLDRNMLSESHTQLPVSFPVATSASLYYPPVSQIFMGTRRIGALAEEIRNVLHHALPLFRDPPHLDEPID